MNNIFLESKNRFGISDGILFLPVYALAFAGNFALAKLLFVVVGKDGFAEYTLIITISLILRITFSNPLLAIFQRYWSDCNERGLLRPYFIYMLGSFGMTVIVAALLFLPMMYYADSIVGSNFDVSPGRIACGLGLGWALGVNATLFESDNAAGHRFRSSLFMLAPSLTQIIAVLSASSLGIQGLDTAAAIAAVLLTALNAIHFYLFYQSGNIRKHSVSYIKTDLIKEMVLFGIPLFIWVVPNLMAVNIDRWLVARYLGTDGLAAFGVILILSQNLLAAVRTILGRAVLPDAYRFAGSARSTERLTLAHNLINRLALGMLSIGCLFGAAYLFIGDFLLAYLFDPALSNFKTALVLLCLGGSVVTVNDIFVIHGHLVKQPKQYIWPKMVYGPLYCLLVLLAIQDWGLVGVGAASLLSAIATAGVVIYVSRKKIGVAFSLKATTSDR